MDVLISNCIRYLISFRLPFESFFFLAKLNFFPNACQPWKFTPDTFKSVFNWYQPYSEIRSSIWIILRPMYEKLFRLLAQQQTLKGIMTYHFYVKWSSLVLLLAIDLHFNRILNLSGYASARESGAWKQSFACVLFFTKNCVFH